MEKQNVNSPINNLTTCSIIGKEVQDLSTTKNIQGNLFPIYSYPIVWFFGFLWGCSLIISMVRKFQGVN